MIRGEDWNECECVFRVLDFVTITHFGKILSAVANYKYVDDSANDTL